ncbi:MAG TPA: CGNR zinc finger domain-containing protein [Gaiellaceae bacterium]|nr:CGNR zinc finger domain-containing protein [Gaiellaceae bacterium]
MVSNLPAYRRLVDGLVLPVPLANHVALDFCNTLAGWGEPAPVEYLTTYAHLAVWAREAGLVDAKATARLFATAERDPATAGRALGRAVALRAALYAACTDHAAGGAWDTVAGEARAAAATAALDPAAPPGDRWRIGENASLDLPVLELARSAGDLLGTVDLDHVGRCSGTGCGWLFLDPRGRRRWCTMAVCGNRAKVRRHADRARTARRA